MVRHVRRALATVAVVAALLQGLASPALAAGTAFKGLWLAIDAGDGSTQLLIVASGPEPSVTYEDFFAGYCFNNDNPSTHWVAAGAGSIAGNTLTVAFHKSGCGTFANGGYSDVYTYDPGTDRLSDTTGNDWGRVP